MKVVENAIVMNSGAPRIAGTRVSVYDIIACQRAGMTASQMAADFKISAAEVDSAIEYIGNHQAEVDEAYAAILARNERGDSPSIRELTRLSAGKAAALREKLRQEKATEAEHHAGHSG